MAVYATYAELTAYLGDRVTHPDQADGERMLQRASELIAAKTGRWAETFWVDPRPDPLTTYQTALNGATVRQVEFWLETGEEHDIVGKIGGAQVGRVQYGRMPDRLAPRASDMLQDAGLLSARVAIV